MVWGNTNGTSTVSFGPTFLPPGVLTLTRSITADTKWAAPATSRRCAFHWESVRCDTACRMFSTGRMKKEHFSVFETQMGRRVWDQQPMVSGWDC
jgi:hypothetical protein